MELRAEFGLVYGAWPGAIPFRKAVLIPYHE